MANKQEIAGGFPRILLLTQEHCGFCTQAQDILKRLAGEYHLSISTLDIQSPEGQKLALQSGFLFPPGVLIEDEPFSYGRLSERKLRRELARRVSDAKASVSL